MNRIAREYHGHRRGNGQRREQVKGEDRDQMILPGTGRWRAEGVTEGLRRRWGSPSTMLRMVPLPVPGRTFPVLVRIAAPLSVRCIGGKVGGDCLLPAVAILEQLGLVVEQ